MFTVNNKIFLFVGASGTGKSTCMKYLSENYNILCEELSARPFLKQNQGSYDQHMTDEIQLKIMYNNTLTILQKLIDLNSKENKSIVYSRSPIDVLAYMLTLNKALFLKEQQIKFINYLRNKVIWLYIPIEFQMQEVSDSLRGINENVRYKTDDNIVRLLGECNIPYYTIHGNMKKRESILDEIMIQYEINKK